MRRADHHDAVHSAAEHADARSLQEQLDALADLYSVLWVEEVVLAWRKSRDAA